MLCDSAAGCWVLYPHTFLVPLLCSVLFCAPVRVAAAAATFRFPRSSIDQDTVHIAVCAAAGARSSRLKKHADAGSCDESACPFLLSGIAWFVFSSSCKCCELCRVACNQCPHASLHSRARLHPFVYLCICTCARLIDASCQLNLFAAVSADRFGK